MCWGFLIRGVASTSVFVPYRCVLVLLAVLCPGLLVELLCAVDAATRTCSDTKRIIAVTILHIIYRPVFYLKLNSTLKVCPYLTGNTSRFCYEPNRSVLSTGL
jgi:hypothetical protein